MTDYEVRLLAKIEELESRPVLDAYGKAALDVAYALLDRATSPDIACTEECADDCMADHRGEQ